MMQVLRRTHTLCVVCRNRGRKRRHVGAGGGGICSNSGGVRTTHIPLKHTGERSSWHLIFNFVQSYTQNEVKSCVCRLTVERHAHTYPRLNLHSLQPLPPGSSSCIFTIKGRAESGPHTHRQLLTVSNKLRGGGRTDMLNNCSHHYNKGYIPGY